MLRFADSAPYTKYKIKRVPGQQTKSCTPKENNCFYRKEKTTHKTGNTAVMRKLRKLEADSDQSTTAPKGQAASSHENEKGNHFPGQKKCSCEGSATNIKK